MKLYGLGPARSLRGAWALDALAVSLEFVPVGLEAGEARTPTGRRGFP